MPVAHIHFEHGQDTIIAVTIGAVLATAGGMLAGALEARMARKERERAAAQLFAEILAAVSVILPAARDARAIGDPYGRVTMRIVRAAYRETEIYDRNREELSAIRDSDLRARLHSLLVRLRMALESVVEVDQVLRGLRGRDDAVIGMSELVRDREIAFEYGLEVMEEIAPLIEELQQVSKTKSDAYLAIRAGLPPGLRG